MYGKINVGGGENLDAPLTEQESLLAQIQEILPFKGAGGLSAIGITKIAVDKFKFSDTVADSTVVNHSLGVKPKIMYIFQNTLSAGTYFSRNILLQGITADGDDKFGTTPDMIYQYLTNKEVKTNTTTTTCTEANFKLSGSTYYASNVEYTVVTMA